MSLQQRTTKGPKHIPPPAETAGRVSAADFLPKHESLEALEKAAESCQGCPLYRLATQTVFGEGPAPSDLMLVGETPGDQEDRQGKPFVGPAGRLLDKALSAAGLSRETVYITNAVKHFKWEGRGKRRLHKKPSAREIAACRPWLEAEIRVVRPRIIVCLGATAAQTLVGPEYRITKQRGVLLPSKWCESVLATHHPSAALRAPQPEQRHRMRDELASDLVRAAAALNKSVKHAPQSPTNQADVS
jgi:uracil-DNA glycosylase family protein